MWITSESSEHKSGQVGPCQPSQAASKQSPEQHPLQVSPEHGGGDLLDAGVCEVEVLARLLVVLLEFVQVGPQQLADQEEVLLGEGAENGAEGS